MNEGYKLMHQFTCGATIRIKGYENDYYDDYRGVTIYIEDNASDSLQGRFYCPECGGDTGGELSEARVVVVKDNIPKVIEILQRYMEMEGEPMKVRKMELADDDEFELVHKNKTITVKNGAIAVSSKIGNLEVEFAGATLYPVRDIGIQEKK